MTEPALTTGPVLVVGTGLLGTSIGLALRDRGVEVLLHDVSPTAQALAADLGAGRPAYEGDVPALVVIATPVDVAGHLVAEYLDRYPYATVTDVGSVKNVVLAATGTSDMSRFVGSHPMAGREKSGPIAARTDLFAGRPWVVVNSGRSSGDALAVVRCLAIDVGASPVTMDAATHDAAVALVSHMPQVMSSLVAARLRDADPAMLELAGQGLRDVTRIASSPPEMWTSILTANSEAVTTVLAALRADLDDVIGALDTVAAGSHATVAGAIAAGNTGVARIPGKHGSAAQSYEAVSVLVPDRPGELARLLTLMGDQGFNLEDLHLEHSPRQPMGVAVISVMPSVRTAFEEMLAAHGWRVAS